MPSCDIVAVSPAIGQMALYDIIVNGRWSIEFHLIVQTRTSLPFPESVVRI